MSFDGVPPHPGQLAVIQSMQDFKVTVHSPGRRWGKSSCRPYIIFDQLSRGVGWVEGCCGAQSHAEATEIWAKDLMAFEPLGAVTDKQNQDQRRYIDFKAIRQVDATGNVWEINRGGRVWYPSLAPDAHSRFQGKGLWFAILDEMSHVPTDAWSETIRPMLADRGGHALIQGSPIPSGINFAGFADLYEIGVPGTEFYDPTWNSMTGPSEENPHIDHKEIAAQRADLIRRGRAALAACLYDGRFVTDLGAVFTNLDAVFVLKPLQVAEETWILRPARPGERVVVSIDFGRHDDSTVAMAMSYDTLEQLGLMRIRRTEYPVQLPLIDKFVRRYDRPQIWSEGREEMAADTLRRMYGDSCALIKWTSGGKFDKATCVARGMDYFERAAVRMLDVRWQRDEFRLFAREKTAKGRWEYNAPSGKHDDSVAAFLYGTYGLPLASETAPVAAVEPHVAAESPFVFRREQYVKDEMADHPFVLRRNAI